ncbi:MAG: C-terminal target protein [Segetibacter sp.]|nr:C-terminal target protein [Segetibacter sp.]
MVIFTRIKKNNRRCVFSKIAFPFSFFLLSSFFLKAQQVTEIITDFGGYWRTNSTTNNTTLPNDSHNLLAFKVGTKIYSTGVNNTVLTSNGVSFTTGNFKCLPITSITGTVKQSYIALAGKYDGVPIGYSSPRPNVKMKDVLTDGINGLNIGTGVIDFPSTAKLTFPVQSVDVNSIADTKPDILFTQIANISTGYNDKLYFVNSSGGVVGSTITLDWGTVPAVGTYTLDFYTLQRGVTCDQSVIIGDSLVNTTRPLRLTAFKLSDFGITSANAALVASLIIQPGGQSDIGFVAYNSDGFVITPPAITSQPQTQVVCTGASSSATFSVTATGTGDTYQWRRDGVNITGATNPSYTVSPVTTSSAGTYDVVVTNGGGSVTSNEAYLNTAITRQPSPSTQTIVTGNTVTLSVSATNATSFQWEKNGVNIAGATDSVYTINPLTTADSGSYTVNAINSANSCATVLSNPAAITPAIVVYSTATGDLNVPDTWGANTDGSGSTPVDFTRAEHTFVLSNRASGNTLTDLTIAGTLDVKNGIAIIANNTTLDVGKCIRTGTGSVSGSSRAGLTVRGNSDLYFTSGSQLLKDLTITGGTVNMLSPLTISGGNFPGKLNLTGGTLALGSNKITIQSTSTKNTSMVTAVGATAAITYGSGGAFIIEKYVIGRRSFRFVSPAATTTTSIKTNWMEGAVNPDRWTNYNPIPGYGTHITGPRTPADSLDVTQTYNPSLFTFDKDAQNWNPVPNSAGTLTAGSPFRFMIRGSRAVDLNDNEAAPSNTIIRTTGSLTIGTYNVGASVLNTKVGGYSFIGNPYACPVDWNTVTKPGISSSYYTWDEKFNRRGTYISYNGAAHSNSNSASEVDKNIQSQQAVLVLSTSTTPSIEFKEINKSYTNTSVFRETGTQTKLSVQLLLNLNGASSDVADGFVAVFGNNFSKAIGDEDSYKFTNLDENMAINRNGTALSIEGRPFVAGCDTLPIKMWQFRQKDYWVKVDAKNFDPALKATLKDEYLKQETPLDLTSSTTVPFTITNDSASFASNRFSIVFGTSESFATLPVILTDVKAYQKDKGIQVDWNTATETNIDKYEVEKSLNSQQFDKVFSIAAKSNNALANSYNWFDNNASSGNNFYRIKIIEKTGDFRYSPVVRVSISNGKSGFAVYPNPVKGNAISLQLSNMEEGKYAVNIFSNTGQKVYCSSLHHTGGSASQTLLLKRKIAAGKYTLQLSNDKTSLNQSILIQ